MTYVGRTDFQVKVRGLRIELGEVDAALTAHASVDFAVTVGHTADRGGVSLVSYVVAAAGQQHIDPAALRDFVGDRLPAHMVPTAIMVIDAIPLTPNGKLDRKALPAPVFEAKAFRAPRTPVEHTIAEVFTEVLGTERVGVDDSFFALGGDSIVSIQLVSRCKARGVVFTPRDVFEQRTVAGLAAVAGAGDAAAVVELPELAGGGVGEMPLPPIVHYMVERPGHFDRFNQTMALELPVGIDWAGLIATVGAVIGRHDMLRSRLYRDGTALRASEHRSDEGASPEAAQSDTVGRWRLEALPHSKIDVDGLIHRREFDPAIDAEARKELAEAELDAALDRLDPANGVVAQFVWLDPRGGGSGRLILAVHHIAVDGVSWRVLVPDFIAAWAQVSTGHAPHLPGIGTSMRRWSHALTEVAMSPPRVAELEMWQRVSRAPDPLLGVRALDDSIDTAGTAEVITVELSESQTRALLTTAPALFHGGVNDVLLSALALALVRWRAARGVSQDSALIRLEGHGREEAIVPGADLSTTVGWFTTMYPVLLDLTGIDTAAALDGTAAMGAALKAVKEQLRAVPDKGMGYGLLRYLNPDTAPQLGGPLPGQVSFNYLGRISTAEVPGQAGGAWLPASDVSGLQAAADADMPVGVVVDINAIVTGERLSAGFAYPRGVMDAADVDEFAGLWIRALAGIVQHASTAGAGGHTPSDFALVSVGQRDIERWEQDYGALTDVWPLAPLQAGMFFHAMLADASVDVYTAQVVLRLGGAADGDRLHAAATAIVNRYPNLRAAFVTDHTGTACQVVPDTVELPWTVADLRGPGGAERLGDLVAADRVRHFDLSRPPLIRFTLARVDSGLVLIATNHHILLDGWSMPLLVRDLLVLYAAHGDDSVLEPVRPFRAYLEWVGNRDLELSRDAWREALAGVDEPTLLAASGRGRELDTVTTELHHVLDADTTARLAALATDLNVTVNTIVQVAWGIVLGHTIGRSDVVFGTTVSGRPADLRGVESMVGLFINTVPVRVRFDPSAAVSEVLARVQAEQSGLLDHHHLNLAEVQATTGLDVLFDTLVVFESYPVNAEAIRSQATDIDGMTIDGFEVSDAAHYPLTLVVGPGEELALRAGYIPRLLDAATAGAIVERLGRTLTAIARRAESAVGDIDVLDAAERGLLLERWSSSGTGTGVDATLVARFERAVTANAERTAVRSGSVEYTYRDLDERATRVARVLIEAGVGPESIVAVALPRSLDLVVALLATLKAGGGYLPIDPSYPTDRIEFMLDDARPVCVLTWSGSEIALPAETPVLEIDTLDLTAVPASRITDAERRAPLRPSNVAYVIYTSGSTGRPKGVVVPHGNVVKLFDNTAALFGFDDSDVWTMFHSYAFDFSVWELWGPLLHGGVLVVVDYETSRAPEQFVELLRDERVTVLNQTPSAFYQFAEADRQAPPGDRFALRYIIFGGEALELRRLTDWYLRHGDTAPKLVNMYGITETTVHVSHRELTSAVATDDARSLVGRAIPGLRSYLLDVRMRPVPVGVVGEIYVGGVQLARGYLGRPALTADRFVADPYGPPGTRLYRTGDQARWTTTGELEYVGRSDFQVKVRGFRIEPGEIEAALTEHESVAHAAVVLRADQYTGDQLVAYLVPRTGTTLDTSAIRDHVAAELPPHMVPSAYVGLDSLPLTANGKLDRKALPAPAFQAARYRAPSTPVEQQVADVFADVLGVEQVGADDSFFDLGGNSIVAARAVALLRSTTGADVRIQWFFNSPTVTGLSTRIQLALIPGARDEGADQPAFEVVLPIRAGGTKPPLFCIHPIVGLAWSYAGLAEHLDRDRPIYGLQSPAFTEDNATYDSVDALAQRYVQEIRRIQPRGPYLLLGWSFGGVLAHAVATQIQAAGEQIATLVVLDSVLDLDDQYASLEIRRTLAELGAATSATEHAPIALADAAVVHDALMAGTVDLPLHRVQTLISNAIRTPQLISQYRPTRLHADIVLLFEAAEDLHDRPSAQTDWQQIVDADLHYYTIDTTHLEITSQPALQTVGPIIAEHLDTIPR